MMMTRKTQHTSRVPEAAKQPDTEAVSDGTRALKIVLATILMSLTGSQVGTAQIYEAVYGADSTSEDGAHLIRVIQPCSGSILEPNLTGGFVAVGTTDSPGGHTDVHVVRTDESGVIVWEKTYDIGNAGNDDEAFDIVETPLSPGFAITGRTNRGQGNGYDAFILKINCSGTVSWSGVYGGTGDEAGNAVIEAYGGMGVSGSAGDLVVAGYSTSTASTGREAWMFRVDGPTGAVVRWSKLYLPNVSTGWVKESEFNDLIEPMWDSMRVGTEPNQDTIPLGDLVAVGWCKGCNDSIPQANDYDGLAVRTDFQGYTQVTGRGFPIPKPLTGFSIWSTTTEDRFNAVTQVIPDWPLDTIEYNNIRSEDVLITGMASVSKIVVLRYNDGNVIPNNNFGSTVTSPVVSGVGQFNIGRDLLEAQGDGVNGSPLRKHDVAITGEIVSTLAQGGQDAYILVLRNAFDPGRAVVQAARYGGSGVEQGNAITRDYGLSGMPDEPLESLGPTTPGFVVVSNTTTPYQLGDPADMYVIKADDNLVTDCEMNYQPTIDTIVATRWVDSHSVDLTGSTLVSTSDTDVDWGDIVCGQGASKAIHGALADKGGLGRWGESGNAYVLRKGSGNLELPIIEGNLQLYLYDVRGVAVWSSSGESLSYVPTSELNSGYYVLRMATQGRLIEEIVIIVQ